MHKVLAIINVELELLSLIIKHPESFDSPTSPTFESDLYVIPKSKDLGIIGIAKPTVPPKSVKFNKNTITLGVGESYGLQKKIKMEFLQFIHCLITK